MPSLKPASNGGAGSSNNSNSGGGAAGPSLLAPIVLNSPPKPKAKKHAKKGPNPLANLTSLDPTSHRNSRTIKPSHLEEMEPPPPIPAAVQEAGYRSRPTSSVHSVRWEDGAPESGYLTPPRRGSAGTESTTGWAEGSPGASSAAGPSGSTRQRRRMGGIFKTHSDQNSTASADGGDEMDPDGTATPGSRRSGNFQNGVRPSGEYTGDEELETPINPKRPSFFRRYFGNSSHGRSLSGWTVDTVRDGENGEMYHPQTPYSPGVDGVLDEGAESEGLPSRRRSFSPAMNDGTMSAPATPRLGSARGARRRATVDNLTEGESSGGRRVFSRRPSFKTRVSRRTSREGERSGLTKDTANRWNALKAGIKVMRKGKAKEKVDQEKSAELVAELSAGTPAALIFASMYQRDEHGHRRIPVLLEQLKVRITESDQHRRHQTLFKVELEYGSGLTRMKWVIWRDFRDFVNLHSRYRVSGLSGSAKGVHRLPKFPRETIPYFKGVRGLDEDDLEQAIGGGDASATEGPAEPGSATHGNPPPTPRQRLRPFIRRMSSTAADIHENGITAGLAAGLGAAAAAGGGGTVPNAIQKHQNYAIKQRQQLEDYLRRLIRMMVFRADSNRLCKFLELSALGVRLAAEGTYHGKEGYLIIRSSKGSDFRRPWNPSSVAKRHTPKWFLVRHSYIVCVDSPEEMNIYDVFLVDSNFFVDSAKFLRKKPKDLAIAPSNPARPQHHSLIIKNHERTLKLLAKNERQLHQFQTSIEEMKEQTIWAKQQRFGSFAPVRTGVFAQWLVDGRDYFWNVSRAISMAKDVIYIHDWWLSPELYLRRPAAVSQKWRLDRLLQRKAQEGVKIFVIVYRNIGAAIPIDSAYTKYSLLDLHPNVYVQRSPNQIRQQTFFWAHHEKILIVDHMIAFVGGIDLCFGRWDTPQHAVVDNKPSGFEEGSTNYDPENFQLWPGKDYSNPRVQDFYNLDKPYEDMYDREKVPRMPWHDIHMQIVGQPARDLTRHFVQRWNYLLRQRTPSRPTPLLLPQPDFEEGELESLGIDGTCEVQILRSATSWSMGTPSHTECSIQNAYLKSIEMSDHLVYIENQFFITSTEFEGTVIENKIGDALVERITRAYNNDEDWRAIIIIPLMPGFQNAIDAQDGTSVRLIMHCQFRSISQGESSIFGRLRAQGIEPEDYIHFFSLRNWGKIGSDQKLVTEQLYIHAKCMVVDDRIAIIGSANINERSMMGTRDSEVAALVRDTDAIESTMAGAPYKVGRFPHTLRVRLMREHLGLDVDAIMQEERLAESQNADDEWESQVKSWQEEGAKAIVHDVEKVAPEYLSRRAQMDNEVIERLEKLRSFNHDVDWEQENNPNLKARKKGTQDPRVSGNEQHRNDVRGFGADHMVQRETERASMSADRPVEKGKHTPAPTKLQHSENAPHGHTHTQKDSLSSPVDSSRRRSRSSTQTQADGAFAGDMPLPPAPPTLRMNSAELGLPQLSQLPALPPTNDLDIGGPILPSQSDTPYSLPVPSLPADFHNPKVAPDMFADPLNDSFYLDIWHTIAKNNTEIYRQVFRCQPDNDVTTWRAYQEFMEYAKRFDESQDKRAASRAGRPTPEKPATAASDATATTTDAAPERPTNLRLNVPGDDANNEKLREFAAGARPRSTSNVSARLNTATTAGSARGSQESHKEPAVHYAPNAPPNAHPTTTGTGTANAPLNGSTRRRRRGTTRSSRTATGTVMDLELAEKLLGMVQGHLVLWPHDWLSKEQETGNWLYNIDQLAPIEIYD
ncbi:hypothetical protein EDC01DRAFT_268193 [Geopyxis carbonaria]|nr:hypothetical protein EDC01DRAFT_268193 [Geopyxis carbonaria]